MKHIAVVGTGAIGLMLGAFLTRGGHDVTLISLFRPSTAQSLAVKGVTVSFDGDTWITPVKAVYWADIPPEEKFDLVFITCKSNDTQTALDKMLPHLASDGCVSSLQNGIPDYVIADRAGADRVVPCVCFAGGQVPEPCHVVTHDGYFIIGELSGKITPRLSEIAEILSCAKRAETTGRIIDARWKKLSEVCLTVPLATLTGWAMFEGLDDWRALRLSGRLACEVMDVERAAGITPKPILGFPREKWAVLAKRRDAALEAEFAASNSMPSPGGEDGESHGLKPADAYTMDIAKGLPLEIWYTNGYVSSLGRQLGVPTPTVDSELEMIKRIESGEVSAGAALLETLITL